MLQFIEYNSFGSSPTSAFATSIDREEASIGNFDSIIEQERAFTIFKLKKLMSEVAKSKVNMIYIPIYNNFCKKEENYFFVMQF